MFNLLCGIVLIIICSFSSIVCNTCDSGNVKLQEGILGEVPQFPWLGVLRVPIKHEGKIVIAATGVVLVSVKFVLVNADDVSRISLEVLRQQAKVYFILGSGKPWTCKAKDVMLHPEYEFATYNTLALVELNFDIEQSAEAKPDSLYPICWPGRAFNTSNELYVAGYTDARLLLEKILFKAMYIAKDMCAEYYKRMSFHRDPMREPKQYVCSVTNHKQQHCQVDNGMLLVSNATGVWTLVGFGTAGPGCSAPARFLDMGYYIDWVQSATSEPVAYDYEGPDDDE